LPPRLGSPDERGCGLGLTNQAQRITALQQVPLLSGLSRTTLGELARRTEEVNVPKGALLYRQGDSSNEGYIILDGSFVRRRHTGKFAICGKGGFLGTISLIDGMPRTATVMAEEDSVVLVVHRRDFKELLEIPRVAMTVMGAMAAGLREADEKNLE